MDLAPLQRPVAASELPPERLAANTALTEQQKITEASRQFEAILLRQILDGAQKTVFASRFSDHSATGSIYRDMVTCKLAEAISRSGTLGLANIFEAQLTRPGSDVALTPTDHGEDGVPVQHSGIPAGGPRTASTGVALTAQGDVPHPPHHP